MSFSSGTPLIPSTPALANLPLATGQMGQSMAAPAEMLPRTTIVASQVGQSLFGQALVNHQYVGRMAILPSISVQEKRDHDKKKRDFIRGVIVTKTEESSDTSEKPKDQ